jgi:hypothetical protein
MTGDTVPPNRIRTALPPLRIQRRTGAAALLALVVAGCAPVRDDDLFGVTLEVESTQAWARDPALERRLHRLLAESSAHVGLDTTMLYGVTLRIVDGGIRCGSVERARGCTWREQGVIAVSTLAWLSSEPPVPCVEDTPIPHELLHLKIADSDHEDPRWQSVDWWNPLHARVSGADCSGDPADRIW